MNNITVCRYCRKTIEGVGLEHTVCKVVWAKPSDIYNPQSGCRWYGSRVRHTNACTCSDDYDEVAQDVSI